MLDNTQQQQRHFFGNGITCWKHRYFLGPTWTLLHLWG